MLVIPVQMTGSSSQSFETRTEWQRAWARFRTGSSPIDYVRTTGSGIDPLLLNAAQTHRPGRRWWRMILDQYGASDILIPEVQLRRFYPGGPIIGTFSARHGPDNQLIARFALRVERSDALPQLLDEGIKRLDAAYVQAFQGGGLRRDPSLSAEAQALPPELAEQIEAATARIENAVEPVTPPPATAEAQTLSVRVDTPTPNSVDDAELAVSRIPGVTSASTTSLALGGTSVMRVTFNGDPMAFEAALRAGGWIVQQSGGTLRISRPAPSLPPRER
jgi:hypothetical protein